MERCSPRSVAFRDLRRIILPAGLKLPRAARIAWLWLSPPAAGERVGAMHRQDGSATPDNRSHSAISRSCRVASCTAPLGLRGFMWKK